MNGIVIFLALSAPASQHEKLEAPPFMSPGKDEIAFLQRCKEQKSSCFYSRILLKEDNTMIRASLNVVSPDDIRLVDGSGRSSFSLPYICERTHVLSISADIHPPDDHKTRPAHITSDESNPHVCYHEIAKSIVEEASKEGALLITRRVTETIPIVDGVLGAFYMEAGTLNRHIITAAEGIPIYLDSPQMMDGSIHRGKISGSTILDDDRRGVKEGSYTIFSTIQSWSAHAKGYERHQRALLPALSAPQKGINLSEIDEIARKLRARFPYQVTADNSGVYPRNSPDQIEKLGVADCKDYVTLLINSLEMLGIRSTAVLTSLKETPPRSLVVPDPIWVDHVIVYIPDFNAYFDLAAEGDSQVRQTSAVYGKLGFRTDTGDPVIIR